MSDPSDLPFDLPALEARVLARWERDRTFEASLDPSRPLWLFLEGPPTMNGRPGVHHVEPRAFKDLFCRYKTMRGHHVPRRAGWDCHGLPVELSVAGRLGLSGPAEVEAFGLERFSDLCRESVEEHQGVFEDLTRRMGFWLDMDDPYRTMDPDYVETVWSFLSSAFDSGALYEDSRVAPWCPSCATALSSHEVAQGYEDVTDPSLVVRLPLEDGSASLLVWTTTPWTLPENLLVGVSPDAEYLEVSTARGTVVTSATHAAADPVVSAGTVLRRLRGSDLVGSGYLPPFGERRPDAHRVVPAPFVEAGSGTALVHLAPSYGADDQRAARAAGVVSSPDLGPRGVFVTGPFAGRDLSAVSSAVPDLLGDLLWSSAPVTHRYPHCWRCHGRLVHLARPCWYLSTTSVAPAMRSENASTEWHPASAGSGRYGAWLEGNVDWAVSRERFWGTPLPLWRCGDGHVTPVPSRAALSALSGRDCSGLDLHRPQVDPVTFPCRCGLVASRVPEVVDCWLDAGLAPLATMGGTPPPLDLVCEGVDQTRGWFYALQAAAHLSHGGRAYRTALALGHVVDEHGEKMSKHKGNVLDPFVLFDAHGADAVRWQLLVDGSPWGPRRVSGRSVSAAAAELARLWSCAALVVSRQDGPWAAPSTAHPLDAWLAARCDAVVSEVTAALERFDTAAAGSSLRALVDDVSLRHLRASRPRLAASPAARAAVREVLLVVSRLLAPFVPFLAEGLWELLGGRSSVHLEEWPSPTGLLPRPDVEDVWALLEEGRAARAAAGLRHRQPLASARVLVPGTLAPELLEVLRVGLNVEHLDLAPTRWRVRPVWRALGRRYGSRTQEVAALLPSTTSSPGPLPLRLDGTDVLLEAEVELVPLDRVALDTSLTPDLVEAGRLADLLRRVSAARRDAGLAPGEVVTVSLSDPQEADLAARYPDALLSRAVRLSPSGVLAL